MYSSRPRQERSGVLHNEKSYGVLPPCGLLSRNSRNGIQSSKPELDVFCVYTAATAPAMIPKTTTTTYFLCVNTLDVHDVADCFVVVPVLPCIVGVASVDVFSIVVLSIFTSNAEGVDAGDGDGSPKVNMMSNDV